MKGVIEQAVIVGCDVDHCARLLIFNRGIDRQDLDEAIRRAGWQPLSQPAGDEPHQQEHACPEHIDDAAITEAIVGILQDIAAEVHQS